MIILTLSMLLAHFFKANSRIGLVNKPIHQQEHNIGVEDGPDELLDEAFLQQFGEASVSEFNFPLPENIPLNEFIQVLTKSIAGFRDFINQNLHLGERQIVIGGDHSITLPSVLAVLQRIKDPQKLGYIHFDSHGDINLWKDSPTENFHGMYLRPLVDKFDIPEIEALSPHKLPTDNMQFIGNLDLDPGERDFFEKKRIKKISSNNLDDDPSHVLNTLKDFMKKYEFLHISFDVDSLDKTEFPATGIPAENGLSIDDVLPLLELLNHHPNLSFDLAEFNPRKSGAVESKKIAQNILIQMLQ